MTSNAMAPVDLERLLKLRLVVARFGEMDGARWWNSKGMLGRLGGVVLGRGFPATHYFAQARVVFAVARSRSGELFNPPGCMTLWNLPAEVEEAFEERWQDWLDKGDEWTSFFDSLVLLSSRDLLDVLDSFGLLTSEQRTSVLGLRRTAEGKAVPLPGIHWPTDEVITLLAAGFARGEVGKPAVPYAKLEA
jgi:hypothetical protein